MNVQEFAALKAGDQIENPMSHSRGEVVSADKTGVAVRWHGVGQNGAGTIRHYSVQSTIWFHWSKAESEVGPALDDAISDELANPPSPIMRDA